MVTWIIAISVALLGLYMILTLPSDNTGTTLVLIGEDYVQMAFGLLLLLFGIWQIMVQIDRRRESNR